MRLWSGPQEFFSVSVRIKKRLEIDKKGEIVPFYKQKAIVFELKIKYKLLYFKEYYPNKKKFTTLKGKKKLKKSS